MLGNFELENRKFCCRRVILLSAIVALGINVFLLLNKIHISTDGHFCYPLDDTFIHLSVAKHLALDGVWGINSEEYGAASSSLLYTVLLAFFIRCGFHSLLLPFCINLIIAVFVLIVADFYLKKFGVRRISTFCILQALVWMIPLAEMALIGMEHILHTLLVIILLFKAGDLLLSPVNIKKTIYVGFIASFAILVRLESLFMITTIGVLFLWQKRYRQAFLFGMLSLLPLTLMGLISIKSGGQFLPNSVLVKGLLDKEGLLIRALFNGHVPEIVEYSSFQATFSLLILSLLTVVSTKLSNKNKRSQISELLVVIWTITCTLHLLFAKVGWLYRYEAWLIGSGIIVIGIRINMRYHWRWEFLARHSLLARVVTVFISCIIFVPLIWRTIEFRFAFPLACTNIYDQQFQMARFFSSFYNNEKIAANDVGAISFYGNNTIVDLWGLGNNEIAYSRLRKQYSTEFLNDLLLRKGVKIAVIYDSWFPADLTQHWIKAGGWTIRNNVVCGDETVSFYATDSTSALLLQNNLKNFEQRLPNKVTVNY